MTDSGPPDPVRHILETFSNHEIEALLMGGQACILYGAAEFSKDVDFAILAEEDNLARLQAALDALDAEVIAVPPFERKWLEGGLAVHFRCRAAQAEGFRIDVMTRMRGVDDFHTLWQRRNQFNLAAGLQISVMALPDLVASKKTQRDKDWPMLRRLVEVDYFNNRERPADGQAAFWLAELRDPDLLTEAAVAFPQIARALSSDRSLIQHARANDLVALADALAEEEQAVRAADRLHWEPLRKMLSDLRRGR